MNRMPQIEFLGREQVTVEEYHGVKIAEYDTETVKLIAGNNKLRLYGSGLLLKKLTFQSVMITGRIDSLEFEQ